MKNTRFSVRAIGRDGTALWFSNKDHMLSFSASNVDAWTGDQIEADDLVEALAKELRDNGQLSLAAPAGFVPLRFDSRSNPPILSADSIAQS